MDEQHRKVNSTAKSAVEEAFKNTKKSEAPLLEIKCFDINQPFEVYYKGEKVLVSQLVLQAGLSNKSHDRSFRLKTLDLESGTYKTIGESTPEADDWKRKRVRISINVEPEIDIEELQKRLYEAEQKVRRTRGYAESI